MTTNNNKREIVGIIGLGYVGLPLACLFSTKYETRGFDINHERIEEINSGFDSTFEVGRPELCEALQHGLKCSDNPDNLRGCTFLVVTVPTPVDARHYPDMSCLAEASATVGRLISPGTLVVFESTVYPGTTEEFCVPIIERESGLKCGDDFLVAYSPERINPGDREHTVRNICKIVSGCTREAALRADSVYSSVIAGGTYLASSIRVAEAAKIIENTQRDVNIAFINEVTKVFNALDIDTWQVLEAASTKWNFLPFKPGLVGGHCISVDPYYLIRQAELYGMRPRLMTEARDTNETMGYYLADRVIDEIIAREMKTKDTRILMLGFAFKENCPDIRNTKVYDTYKSLRQQVGYVMVYDPVVDPMKVKREYSDVELTGNPEDLASIGPFNVVVRCVAHSCFSELDLKGVTTEDFIDVGIVGSPTRCRGRKQMDL